MYKVIVIDDEMLVRRGIVMETDWQALNCVVVAEAGNGIEGLEAVRKYHPDLLNLRYPYAQNGRYRNAEGTAGRRQ